MVKSDISGLGKWSKQLIDLVCDDCGVEKSIKYKLYTSYGYKGGEYFCRKCKTKRNNLEKWGVEHVFQSEKIKEKIKKTNLKNWGVENPSQNLEIREKIKESISKLDKSDINKKRESTNLEKWGVKNISQIGEVKEKKIKTNRKNWNVDNNKKGEEFRKKYFKVAKHPNYIRYLNSGISIFKCDNSKSHTFEIGIDNFLKRMEYGSILCTECHPIGTNQSSKETHLYEFIMKNYTGEVIRNFKSDRKEIDIYIPDLKTGFEFNGVWWHSDFYKEKDFHLNKTRYFNEIGIRIIHIWEDDWNHRQDILKNQIKNILGLNSRVWARNCRISEVQTQEAVEFLNKNHLQGSVGSNIKLGLYHGGELISLMTFDNLEGRSRMPIENWNINRFCNLIDTVVVGGASKLFKHFLKNYKVQRIISYADRDWSMGELYLKLGFKKIKETNPDYKYIVNGKRIHKSKFKKSITGVSESKINIPKVWDCGKIKFEYIPT